MRNARENAKITELSIDQQQEVIQLLYLQWGINYSFVNEKILVTGKDRLWLCPVTCTEVLLFPLNIESLGLCFAVKSIKELRLTTEGAQLFGPLATKSILQITLDQVNLWVQGKNIPADDYIRHFPINEYILLQYNDDFIGCGKIFSGGVLNYVAKGRQIPK